MVKEHLHIMIDSDIKQALIEIAPRVYGRGRGGVSALVEDAVRHYLGVLQAHTKHKTINPSLSIREEYNMFISKLKEFFKESFDTEELPPVIKVSLANRIMLETFKRAKDERTRLSKLHNWFLHGLIKPLVPPIKPEKPRDWKRIVSFELVSRGEA